MGIFELIIERWEEWESEDKVIDWGWEKQGVMCGGTSQNKRSSLKTASQGVTIRFIAPAHTQRVVQTDGANIVTFLEIRVIIRCKEHFFNEKFGHMRIVHYLCSVKILHDISLRSVI